MCLPCIVNHAYTNQILKSMYKCNASALPSPALNRGIQIQIQLFRMTETNPNASMCRNASYACIISRRVKLAKAVTKAKPKEKHD